MRSVAVLGPVPRTHETDDAVLCVDRHMVFEFESAFGTTVVPGPKLAACGHLDILH